MADQITTGWVDKVYYGLILSSLAGVLVWAIKSYVGNALKHLGTEIGHVKEGVDKVEKGLGSKTKELKDHFDKTCGERQLACSTVVNTRVSRLEKHGHVGLKGDESKITY